MCFATGCLAALITNDAACVVITPLLLTEHKQQERNPKELWPLCLAIATSANIGSAATFFGNPQNAFIASAAGISLSQFLVSLFPAAVLGLLLNTAFLYVYYSCRLVCAGCGCRWRRQDNPVTNMSATSMSGAGSTGDSEDKGPFDDANIASSQQEFCNNLKPDGGQQSLNQASQPCLRRQPGDVTDSASNNYGTFPRSRAQSVPLPSPEEDQDMEEAASTVRITHQTNIPATANEPTPVLVRERQGTENEGKTDTDSTVGRRYSPRQRVIFLIWLTVISLISLILLIVPPQMIEHICTVIKFDLGLVPFGAAILTMLVDYIVYLS